MSILLIKGLTFQSKKTSGLLDLDQGLLRKFTISQAVERRSIHYL